MKKMICFVLALCSFGIASAQLDSKSMDFYGVDFSLAKVYAASETPEQFKKMFNAINPLLIREQSKYNIGKYFKKEDVKLLVDVTDKKNEAINCSDIITKTPDYVIDPERIAEEIKSYEITPKNELGMVIIAEMLDKVSNKGTYNVVFFNTKTKEILLERRLSGKTGGFGLRNFWAGSIHDMMRIWSGM